MCFSATASFTSAALLTIVGAASLIQVREQPRLLLLALIPLLFAFQQATEGLVWLSLKGTIPFVPYANRAKSVFLLIAFVIWPIWIPLSLYIAEQLRVRKGALLLFVAAGVILAAANLYRGLKFNAEVVLAGQHLKYSGNWPDIRLYYLAMVAIPSFISSLKRVWIFGFLILVTSFITDYLYRNEFISVWCFFAAIMSLCLYFILSSEKVR